MAAQVGRGSGGDGSVGGGSGRALGWLRAAARAAALRPDRGGGSGGGGSGGEIDETEETRAEAARASALWSGTCQTGGTAGSACTRVHGRGVAHCGGAIVAVGLVIAVAQAATRTASFEKRNSGARFSGESASSQAAAARAFGAIQDGRVSAPSVGVGRLRAQAWPPRAGRRRRRHPRCLSDSSRESRSNGTVLSTLLLASNYPPNYRGARRGRKHVTNGWMDTPPDILK